MQNFTVRLDVLEDLKVVEFTFFSPTSRATFFIQHFPLLSFSHLSKAYTLHNSIHSHTYVYVCVGAVYKVSYCTFPLPLAKMSAKLCERADYITTSQSC